MESGAGDPRGGLATGVARSGWSGGDCGTSTECVVAFGLGFRGGGLARRGGGLAPTPDAFGFGSSGGGGGWRGGSCEATTSGFGRGELVSDGDMDTSDGWFVLGTIGTSAVGMLGLGGRWFVSKLGISTL